MEKESEMSTNTNEYMYQYKGAALQQSGQTGVPGHGDQQRGGAQRDGTDPQHYISMNENELGANQQNLLGEREESATVSTAEEPAGVPNPLNALDITVQSPRDSAAVNEDYEIMTPPISPSLANKLSRERINEVQQPPVYLSLVTTTQTNSLLQSNASSVPPVIAHSSRTQRPVLSQVTQPVPQTGPTTSYLTPANNQGVASPRLNTVQSLSAQSQATRSNQPKDYLYPLQSYSICGQPVFVPQTAVAAHQIPIASQPPGRAAPITSVTAQPGIRQPANQIQDLSRPTNRLMTTAQPHAGTSHPAPVVRLQEGTVQLNNGRDRQVNGTTQQVSIVSHFYHQNAV